MNNLFAPSPYSARIVVCGLALAVCSGCGSDDFGTAPVSGTVTMNGQPVSGGNLLLTPIAEGDSEMPGKSAAARVQKDGTFVLTTYEKGDGAVIGKHRVSYVPSTPTPETNPARAHAAQIGKSPYAGAKPKVPEVEIKPGDNTLNIELVK